MSIIKNNLVVFPTAEPKERTCDYTLQTASLLAKNNNIVVYFLIRGKSIKKIIFIFFKNKKRFRYFYKEKNTFFFNKIDFLPFKRFNFIVQINLIINILVLGMISFLFRKEYKNKIVWTFPVFTPGSSHLLHFFKNYFSIYDAIDYYFSFDKKVNKAIRKQERLSLEADIVTTISHSLYQLYKKKRKKVWLVPQGFAQKEFEKYQNLKPSIKLSKNKPIIGFVGGISCRFDFPLLFTLISKNPNFNFVFIGPYLNIYDDIIIKTKQKLKKLFSFPNSFHFKTQPKKYIPNLINQFDVAIIPYNLEHLSNLHCYPMKILEYFYIGKPVVSTPILELKRLQPYVKIAKNAKGFEKEIKKILKSGWPKDYKKKQKQIALANSWQAKIEKISQILKKEFPEKFND